MYSLIRGPNGGQSNARGALGKVHLDQSNLIGRVYLPDAVDSTCSTITDVVRRCSTLIHGHLAELFPPSPHSLLTL